LKSRVAIGNRKGTGKSAAGCSASIAAALPSRSLKLSANGVSRWSSGAEPAAHFAPVAQRDPCCASRPVRHIVGASSA
jgi:hypothetical protein